MYGKRGLIILDLDGTILDTVPLYNDATKRFAHHMATEWRADEQAILDIFQDWDLSQANAQGFSRHRFPQSMVDVAVRHWERQREEVTPVMIQDVRRIGYSVFRRKAPLFPDAVTSLERLYSGFHLALHTLGDDRVQNKRINASGIRLFFKKISIVPAKTTATLEPVVAALEDIYKTRRADMWMVGDSLRSDIAPALECGLTTLQVSRTTWNYDNGDCCPDFIAHSLTEAADLLVREVSRRAA